MLDDEQHQAFRMDGFVRLPGALPEAVTAEMLERLWCLLEAKGANRDDASTWNASFACGLQAIRKSDPEPRQCEPLREALDAAFCGAEWSTKPHWGQALVTFPVADRWNLPRGPWHLDHPFVQGSRVSGVNMFLFVDTIEPRGGGTLVLRSSPQLIGRFVREMGVAKLRTMKAAEIKSLLFASQPVLKELTGKPMRPGRTERLTESENDIDGISVRVVELVGEPGDVVLAHPWLLHTISQNVSDRPRLMRASRVYRRDFYEKYMKPSAGSAGTEVGDPSYP
jgi:hypothetical protein